MTRSPTDVFLPRWLPMVHELFAFDDERVPSLRLAFARILKYDASLGHVALGYHCDGPLVTLGVALNGADEYDGGARSRRCRSATSSSASASAASASATWAEGRRGDRAARRPRPRRRARDDAHVRPATRCSSLRARRGFKRWRRDCEPSLRTTMVHVCIVG